MSDDESQSDRQKLISRRAVLNGQLARFATFLENKLNHDKIMELNARLQQIEQVSYDFSKVQTELEMLDQCTSTEEERFEFEDKYFPLVATARQIIEQFYTKQSQSVAAAHNLGISSNNSISNNLFKSAVQLPPVALPEFDGSYDKWTTFFDTFSSLVNNNKNLSNVEKYYYLQASLKEEAKNVIDSLAINDENYIVAWDLLTERYENKKYLIKGHMKQIFELPSVTKDSHASLRTFLDTFLKQFRALKNLNEPVDSWNTILIYLLASKLDVSSKREWEIKTKDDVSPTIDFFISFLTDRCRLLESLQTKVNKSYVHVAGNKRVCIFCKEEHLIYYCKRFLKMSASARFNEIKKLKACTNCLRIGHSPNECESKPCQRCSKKHNSLLHFNNQARDNKNVPQGNNQGQVAETLQNSSNSGNIQNKNSSNANNSDQNPQTNSEKTFATHTHNDSLTILSTALVNIYGKDNKTITCRALLDSGSQSNFMTQNLQKRLGLQPKEINMPVVGINSAVTNISTLVKTKIKSTVFNNDFVLQFLVINKITDNIPQSTFDCSSLGIPSNIKLADPNFYQSQEIEILLGANIFYNLLLKDQINLGKNKPIIQNTLLGWVISGSFSDQRQDLSHCYFLQNNDLSNQLESFWSIEECSVKEQIYSKEEQEVEQFFRDTVKRDETGKFLVRLPFKENYLDLGDSMEMATKRFQSLEHKLNKNPNLREKYSEFMSEYEVLGHMSPIDTDIKPTNVTNYYLPHHSVVKEGSLTTKLRVVFDASAKTSSNLSLNDVLKVGPSIQSSIFSILLRFRVNNIVFTADIAKMYRCIEVDERDQNYQRIIWRTDPSQPVVHYKLNTLTYGTACASFLATRCLKELALENNLEFPNASQSIQNNFYMDDWLDGGDNIEAVLELIKNVHNILTAANFNLRQWTSNDKRVLEYLQKNNQSLNSQYIVKDVQDSKTLGVRWNSSEDNFQYATNSRETKFITKRFILSVISQIFDPLGLIGPVIIRAKIMLQSLWQLKIDWDDPIPEDLKLSWIRFYEKLHSLNEIKIPRHFFVNFPKYIELHCFSDASQAAYGACIYFKSVDQDENVLVRLVCAKSRVAPLKTITVPRLELCGALLATNLCKTVVDSLGNLNINKTYFWCDSTIVLAWIATDPSKLKQFVANRISKIQANSNGSQWKHVPTKHNPADLISRGLNPDDIKDQTLWFSGPDWLSLDNSAWPKSGFDYSNIDVPELKSNQETTIISIPTEIVQNDILFRFSDLMKLFRVTAYINRFKNNTLNKENLRVSGPLTVIEINESSNIIVKMVQSQVFSSELQSLRKTNSVPKNSKLLPLNPYLDECGIIRVGGKIKIC